MGSANLLGRHRCIVRRVAGNGSPIDGNSGVASRSMVSRSAAARSVVSRSAASRLAAPSALVGVDRAVVDALELFVQLSDAVRASVSGLSSDDRLSAGDRAGQYRLDLTADMQVIESLVTAGFNVLSEESGYHDVGAALTVVVDPVDGSTNASRGLPWWASSFALVDVSSPVPVAVASVVADQAHGRIFSAVRGYGAWVNGAALGRLSPRPVSESIVGVNGQIPIALGWAQTRTFGALALDLCSVAEGSLDAYIDAVVGNHAVWDYLGACLVLAECGGAVVDAFGRDLCVIDHGARRSPVAAASPEACSLWLERAGEVCWK